MLKGQLLNSDASLNNYKELSTLPYTAGETLKVVFQLESSQLGIRYMLDPSATVTVSYFDTSNVEQTKVASVLDAQDRSIWTITFSDTETQTIGTSNLDITVDALGDATIIYKTTMQGALQKSFASGDC